jgi:alpha-glucosidase
MSVPWWQTAVIYQIYPRSFQDSNGDGVGDLRGIEQRLALVVELGADAIWLSPIFTSPMADFGCDIADYKGIDPLFGSMDDFNSLLAATHRRGLKLILDLVPNHTSDQYPWFVPEDRPTTGNPNSAAEPGSTTRVRPNTTIMRFCRSSRTSIGGMPTSGRPCTTSCGSG